VGNGGFAVAHAPDCQANLKLFRLLDECIALLNNTVLPVMTRYRRAKIEGGTFFFTVALADRSSDLLVRHIDRLRRIYKVVQDKNPFESVAVCVLPDHLHAVWTLPSGDANFPLRWALIKSGFSRGLAANIERSASKVTKREKGVWQRRYWEHSIRDDTDLARHVDYIHFNPVKHRYVSRVSDWPYSSFHRYVARGLLPLDWGGDVAEITGAFGE
jgi:putative transposase